MRAESYDYLIVATGSVTSYFNTPQISKHAFELKTLDDAVTLRNHILRMVERAVWAQDEGQRKALTTIVVVGGGPTGLETAGAMHELYAHVLRREYPYLQDKSPNVILVEATDTLLIPFPERLQTAAVEQLKSLGVEVRFGNPVSETAKDHIRLIDGSIIPTFTLVWAAGVQASPLAAALDLPINRNGRIVIKSTTEAETADAIYVVGDMAYLEDKTGQPYPMLIPVAKQQGMLAARNILRRINGQPQQHFQYIDRGVMATIGRSRAVAWLFNRIPLRGYIAWISWLGLHLIALMGFRNRLNVLINWIWNYFTYDRSVRIILEVANSDQPNEQA
jgi:NADH dehydrogenase